MSSSKPSKIGQNAAASVPPKIKYFGAAEEAAENNAKTLDSRQVQGAREEFWQSSTVQNLLPNWDQLFPFQLLMGTFKEISAGTAMKFTLPIPPQSLNISTPFAINTSVTMGGILEEHNGAPLRMITLQGTTGVLPLKGTVRQPSKFLQDLSAVLAGTVRGARSVQTAVAQAGNLSPSLLKAQAGNNINQTAEVSQGTGFIQFHLLRRFLETYVNAKKNGSKDFYLAFAIWKDREIYFVTPASFDLSRQAVRPNEYPFSISFKAWRRIEVQAGSVTEPYSGHIGAAQPNKFAQVLNALETSRRILEGARSTLEGVRADIQQVLYTPLRQVSLFAKDVVGVAITAADLPGDVVRDLEEPILEAVSAGRSLDSLRTLDVRLGNNLTKSLQTTREAFRQLSLQNSKPQTNSGRIETELPRSEAAPAIKISKKSRFYWDFFSKVEIQQLPLRSETAQRISEERRRVRQLDRKDFENFRDITIGILADFADRTGAGNATFTETFGLPSSATTTRTPSEREWQVIYGLSGLAQQYDTLAASGLINPNQVTSMDYIAGLASRSGIAFTVPRSKFAVPFPYGYTLEQLSRDYLGTPERWHEIAALNGLLSPYVDEIGFVLPLAANGSGRQIIVNSVENVFSGQKIWISSQNQKREVRRILSVSKIGGNQFLIELDGLPDLQRYTTVAGAFLQGFLPNTVNSQQQIFIPSDQEPADFDFRVKDIPGVDYFNPIIQNGGMDLLLTNDNDLVITSTGDTRLALGMTAIIQRIRVALGTPKGALLHHPNYGIGLVPGTSTADLDAEQIKQGLTQLFRNDPAIGSIAEIAVNKTANNLKIKAVIGIRGANQFVPLEFSYSL